MKRKPMKSNQDKRIFRHTAMKTNSVNVRDVVPRGGIRM